MDRIDAKEILSRINIVNVIKEYLPLTKKGRNYYALCPFHNDSNPSMVISEEKQIFKCFVCGAGGNAINFVQKKENISYRDALIKVAEMAGFDVSSLKKTKIDKFSIEKRCMKDLSEFYTSIIELNSNKEALTYCEERGLNFEIRKRFNIGYAPIDGSKTIEYLKRINDDNGNQLYSLKVFQDIGIVAYKHGEYIDINSNRIVFGITNEDGEIVAFSARYYQKDRPLDVPKYINTKETNIFHKSDILYNLSNAKNIARDKGYLYIVEGFMDVIALYKSGIESVVALMGTALSDSHISSLKKLNCEIRLCLDNDDAGQTMTLSIIKKLVANNINFKIVKRSVLAKDSDDILSKFGKEKLIEVLNNLISQQDFILDFYSNDVDFSNDDSKKTFIKNVLKEISGIDDVLEIEVYCNKLAKMTSFSKTNIEKEFYKYKVNNSIKSSGNHISIDYNVIPSSQDEIKTSNMNLKRIYKLEHLFIKLMLDDENLINFFRNDNNVIFVNPLYSEIFFYINSYVDEFGNFNSADFIGYVDKNSMNSTSVSNEISNIMFEKSPSINMIKIKKYLNELAMERNIYIIDSKISSELNDEKKAELMKEKSEILLKKAKGE